MTSSRVLKIAVVFLDIIIAISALFYFYSNRIYYIGSDSYYYLSLADSLVTTGKVRDLTIFPSEKPVTPQNGIVYLMALLKIAGLSSQQIISFIPFLNFSLYVISFSALAKTALLFKFSSRQILILSLFYYSHWVLYRLQMIPVNDGIFNSLGIWAIYLISCLFYSVRRRNFFFLLVLSLIGVHFRLNLYLILLSAIISYAIFAQWRKAVLTGIIVVLVLLTFKQVFALPLYSYQQESDPLTSISASQDLERIPDVKTYSAYYTAKAMRKMIDIKPFLTELKQLLVDRTAELFLVRFDIISSHLNWIFLIFTLIPLIGVIRGISLKDFSELFFSLVALTSLAYTLLVGIINNRYIFLYYILVIFLLVKWMNISRFASKFIYAYASIIILYSFFNFSRPYHLSCNLALMLEIKNRGITLPGESLLLAEEKRHAYFFLNKPKINIERFPWLVRSNEIFVAGSYLYVEDTLAYLERLSGTDLKDYQLLSVRNGQDVCSLIRAVKG